MTGRFTEAAMTSVMRNVAAHLHAPSDDAVLLRLTNNAVFALPGAGIVVRITRSYGLQERVAKIVGLGRWFAAIDAPTIRLAPGADQPIAVDGLLATVWTYLPPRHHAPTVTDLGRVLHEFHRLGAPSLPLPVWDPVSDARKRLADAEALNDTDRDFLLDWCQRLEPRVTALNERASGLIHADAHAGNLLHRHAGRVVLCDFDATCRGPWQVDLVATAVGEARFGRPGVHHELARAYGYDVTTDPAWPTLREARELKMVIAAVPLLASTPGVADEFAIRLRSIRHGEPTARWTPFADLHTTPST